MSWFCIAKEFYGTSINMVKVEISDSFIINEDIEIQGSCFNLLRVCWQSVCFSTRKPFVVECRQQDGIEFPRKEATVPTTSMKGVSFWLLAFLPSSRHNEGRRGKYFSILLMKKNVGSILDIKNMNNIKLHDVQARKDGGGTPLPPTMSPPPRALDWWCIRRKGMPCEWLIFFLTH